MRRTVILTAIALSLLLPDPYAAAWQQNTSEDHVLVDPARLQALEYEMIGPNRGGRSPAVHGVPGKPYLYYMGTSGGGVWKTTDAGMTWQNISDGFFDCSSIGAIAIAPGDENVIYVGTGETNPRGDIQTGCGIYKSVDAGKTWTHIGLRQTEQIGAIQVHPDNPDTVYVAALGHLFGPNPERGVYRSKDGGETWELVLHISEKAGAVDIALNPNNPRQILAAIWEYVRQPWTQVSGGPDSGLYRSTDGGDTWQQVTDGMPDGPLGKIGLAWSPANPDRVWASIEADKGGLYRSEDGGKSWQLLNADRTLRQRPFYYSTIFADPVDENTMYICNVRLHRTVDGGKSFEMISTPHGDTHDHWINPDNPEIMINGNDGGACVSFNAGKTWSTQQNQPTAEFYRLETDNQFPYRVYGAQQDNSTISVNSRQMYRLGRYAEDMYAVGGGEQGHIAVDPRDANIVYAGNYDGTITRYNHRTGMSRNIKIWPEMGVGLPAAMYRYRFQMNAPIELSPHDPDVIYHASNYVHRSTDGGFSWETISGDLTRNDPEKQVDPGGPITFDKAGGPENYNTIFALKVSPHDSETIWVGTDDGLVHITRDNGATWNEITPPDMPQWATVNEIEISPHTAGTAWLAVQRYRLDDFTPYIFVTENYGQSWRLISSGQGIADDHFVRVVREDPQKAGLLYAGTEFGIYVSFNSGDNWQPLQLNLPVVQVADLQLKDQDIVVATHGRSFWILFDRAPLWQVSDAFDTTVPTLLQPSTVTMPFAATFYYWLPAIPAKSVELAFDILDEEGNVIRTIEVSPEQREKMKTGLQKLSWDCRTDGMELPEGWPLWGSSRGPRVYPGQWTVRMRHGETAVTRSLTVQGDPRLETTDEQYRQSYRLSRDVLALAVDLLAGVDTIRSVRRQVTGLADQAEKAGHGETLNQQAENIAGKLTDIEEALIQVKLQAGQDILNYRPKLLHQLARLLGHIQSTDLGPHPSHIKRYEELHAAVTGQLDRLKQLLDSDVGAFNAAYQELGIPPVVVPEAKK